MKQKLNKDVRYEVSVSQIVDF